MNKAGYKLEDRFQKNAKLLLFVIIIILVGVLLNIKVFVGRIILFLNKESSMVVYKEIDFLVY